MPSSYLYDEAEHQRHVARFGRLLRQWRERNGWTQYTAYKWAKEAGFTAMAYSTLSVMENGKAPKPRPETFFALAELNRRLAAQDWTGLHTRELRDQVQHGFPLLSDDGKPWGPMEFWGCHVGLIPVPSAFEPCPEA